MAKPYYRTGLNPARRPAQLMAAEVEFRDAKLAEGTPLSAIAKMLARPLETLERAEAEEDLDSPLLVQRG
jgi:hypothetical protein